MIVNDMKYGNIYITDTETFSNMSRNSKIKINLTVEI